MRKLVSLELNGKCFIHVVFPTKRESNTGGAQAQKGDKVLSKCFTKDGNDDKFWGGNENA